MARYSATKEAADIELAVELTDRMRDLEAQLADISRQRTVVFDRILTRGTTSQRELSRRCDVAPNAIRSARSDRKAPTDTRKSA